MDPEGVRADIPGQIPDAEENRTHVPRVDQEAQEMDFAFVLRAWAGRLGARQQIRILRDYQVGVPIDIVNALIVVQNGNMNRLSKTQVGLIIAALLYVVSPFDFIPEIIAGPLGIADDAAILGLVAAMILRAAQKPEVVTVPVQRP
jgi:uncharacterized membrane protein YkvA (DUF1232 family)